MNNKPMALTGNDIKEFAANKDIQEMWGADSAEDMTERLMHEVYAVKFDYMFEGLGGYRGDYYILTSGGEPVQIIRNPNGLLRILNLEPNSSPRGMTFL